MFLSVVLSRAAVSHFHDSRTMEGWLVGLNSFANILIPEILQNFQYDIQNIIDTFYNLQRYNALAFEEFYLKIF
jgi:hypothetical protein